MEDEDVIECPKCKVEMELLTEDEGGMKYHWCNKCGKLCEEFDGDLDFRSPKS